MALGPSSAFVCHADLLVVVVGGGGVAVQSRKVIASIKANRQTDK